jgi:hypothetical protein
MNLNSDNGGNYRQGFTTTAMIKGQNYCAENISAVSKSGIKKSRRTGMKQVRMLSKNLVCTVHKYNKF